MLFIRLCWSVIDWIEDSSIRFRLYLNRREFHWRLYHIVRDSHARPDINHDGHDAYSSVALKLNQLIVNCKRFMVASYEAGHYISRVHCRCCKKTRYKVRFGYANLHFKQNNIVIGIITTITYRSAIGRARTQQTTEQQQRLKKAEKKTGEKGTPSYFEIVMCTQCDIIRWRGVARYRFFFASPSCLFVIVWNNYKYLGFLMNRHCWCMRQERFGVREKTDSRRRLTREDKKKHNSIWFSQLKEESNKQIVREKNRSS